MSNKAEKPMQIVLLKDLPLDDRHGCKKGKIFEVVEHVRGGVKVMGAAKELVTVHSREFDVIPPEGA